MSIIESIKSIKEPKIIEARNLISVAGRRKIQKFLLEGYNCIQFALQEKIAIERVFCSSAASTDRFLFSLLERDIPCFTVSEGILKKISHTNYLIPYIGVADIPSFNLEKTKREAVIVLNQIEDHEMIGTIIRSAYFAGIKNIIATTLDFDPFFRKIVTASNYTVFSCRLEQFSSQEEVFRHLQEMQYQMIRYSAATDFIFSSSWSNQSVAIIVE